MISKLMLQNMRFKPWRIESRNLTKLICNSPAIMLGSASSYHQDGNVPKPRRSVQKTLEIMMRVCPDPAFSVWIVDPDSRDPESAKGRPSERK